LSDKGGSSSSFHVGTTNISFSFQIWDTLKGQVQTEFADITSSEGDFYAKPERGHLSVDYKCMKWLSLDKKVKYKSCFVIVLLNV